MNLSIEYRSEKGELSIFTFKLVSSVHSKTELGGYKDLYRNVHFRNAYSQTDQPVKRLNIQKMNRDTQIFDVETKSVNPLRELGTQTLNPQLFIESRNCKEVKPMKYFNSDLWVQRQTEATLFIQKIIRGFLARKRMKNIKSLTKAINAERNILINNNLSKIETLRIQEIDKRANPRVN